MSHEMRTPLSIIVDLADELGLELDPLSERGKSAMMIRNAAVHLEHFVMNNMELG